MNYILVKHGRTIETKLRENYYVKKKYGDSNIGNICTLYIVHLYSMQDSSTITKLYCDIEVDIFFLNFFFILY